MMKVFYGAMFFFVFISNALALEPMSVNIEWSWVGPRTVKYTLKSVSSSSSKSFSSAYCLRGAECQISIGPSSGIEPGNIFPLSDFGRAGSSYSMSTIMASINSKDLPISNLYGGSPERDKCLYVTIWIPGSTPAIQGSDCNPSNPPPPEKVVCTFSGDVSLLHGTLAASAVDGNRAMATNLLSCTGPATVKVKVTGGSGSNILKLAANGSLYSTLKVNDQNGSTGTNISIPSSGAYAPVLFTSDLSVNGTPSSGSFSASAVATIEVI